jgi:hypothetical protein
MLDNKRRVDVSRAGEARGQQRGDVARGGEARGQ